MLQHAPSAGIARRFAHQRGREHPGPLNPRQIAVVRHAAHVADAPFGVAAAQPDDLCEQPGQRARARESILVYPQPEVTVRAGRVGVEDAAVDVAHCLRILGRAERVPMLLALARPIPERCGEPEVRLRRDARARQRESEQRIDALELEVGGIARGRPPDVRACLEHDGGRIGRVMRGEAGEVRRRLREVPPVQRVETGPQLAPLGKRRGATLEHQYRRGNQPHVSEERR